MKSVVVTGGAGFIGRNLIKELLKRNEYYVVCIDNLYSGREANIEEFCRNKNFAYAEMDIADEGVLHNAFKTYNPEIVFHLAAVTELQDSIKRPLDTNNVNVTGTLRVLEAARQTDVKRVVFSSSSSVYGETSVDQIPEYESKEPLSPYAVQKLIGEEYCKLYNRIYGIETICLRLFNVYGPHQKPIGAYATLIPKTIRKCLDYETPDIYGTGEQTRDFIYVEDVVNAFIIAGTTDKEECIGESFNIGTGTSTKVSQVVDEIQRQTSTIELEPNKLPAVPEAKYVRSDIEKAQKFLEWRVKTDLTTGLKKTVEYFEER